MQGFFLELHQDFHWFCFLQLRRVCCVHRETEIRSCHESVGEVVESCSSSGEAVPGGVIATRAPQGDAERNVTRNFTVDGSGLVREISKGLSWKLQNSSEIDQLDSGKTRFTINEESRSSVWMVGRVR